MEALGSLGKSYKIKGRQRVDSVLHGLLDEERDYKRMKTDDARWKKIDGLIGKNTT